MRLSVTSRLHALLVRFPGRVRFGPVILAEERALGVDDALLHFHERLRAGRLVPATLEDVLLFCHWWARWADRQPFPEPHISLFPGDAVMSRIARIQQAREP